MRKYTLVFIMSLAVVLAACTVKSTKVSGFSSPESVTSDGTFFYVSNVGEKLAPTERDGDGFISKLTGDGRIDRLRFAEGLNAPKGMAVLGDVLYVADIERIRGFELKDGHEVFNLDLSGAGTSFLNDITVFSENELLVTATDIGAVILVRVGAAPSYQRLESNIDLAGINGITFDQSGGNVYFVTFGTDNKPTGFVGSGRISGGKFIGRKICSKEGYYDGIAVHNGKVLASDWVEFKKSGLLIQVDPESGSYSNVDLPEKIGGPADFYLDEKGERLWIPMMLENKVLIYGLGN
ncbi:hypothetical protein [Maridesulfovibrio sp.]|uniref:hypothetical protein n=1 Tax=Maridesulfovibrio sp. TaxID=2795000 RepID=UPI002A18E557|nr:hypothetical protein [Maridesulfovibrio sp.]